MLKVADYLGGGDGRGLVDRYGPMNGWRRERYKKRKWKVLPKTPSITLPFGLDMIFLTSEVEWGTKVAW